MANPTTNFGWVMPTSTDLVTDLPADFAVFGQGVDTSMADLKGGTTGQILAKATNTDMDFTWITNDQGDITAVNTTAPLAGGGTSGALTLSIAAATTSVAGAVQLSDSTSTTSSVLAATPTAVKSAYDLADGAIAKTTVTTAGDIIYRNATVPTRLGLGTAGQVLTVNTGATAPEWKTPAGGGGKVLQVVQGTLTTNFSSTNTSFVDSGLTVTITPSLATSKVMVFAMCSGVGTKAGSGAVNNYSQVNLVRTSTQLQVSSIGTFAYAAGGSTPEFYTNVAFSYLDSPATTSATTYKVQGRAGTGGVTVEIAGGSTGICSIVAMEIGA